ncbi:MAG: hypothetical protein Q4B99_03500 [Clostridia bacterium]|nr:hypothetical protein [Clostridia bacterium]
MKKLLTAIALTIAVLAVAGCACNPVQDASPSPQTTFSPTSQPTASPTLTTTESPADTTPDTSPEMGEIEGFQEGNEVDFEDNAELASAIMVQYPNAVIKSVTHAMHEGRQAYRVVFDNGDQTDQVVYLDSNYMVLEAQEGSDEGTGGESTSNP